MPEWVVVKVADRGNESSIVLGVIQKGLMREYPILRSRWDGDRLIMEVIWMP